jgi:hypothetical protein
MPEDHSNNKPPIENEMLKLKQKGEINVKVSIDAEFNSVIVQLGKSVNWLVLNPVVARQLGQILINCADKLRSTTN